VTPRARTVPALTPARMRAIPLPRPDEGGDKEERGRVLVAGGERQNPGALVLSGTAALRAGAGKLRLAAPASIAVPRRKRRAKSDRIDGFEFEHNFRKNGTKRLLLNVRCVPAMDGEERLLILSAKEANS